MTYLEKSKAVPDEMRQQKSWCLWALEKKKDRMTKVPYQVNGQHSSSTDSDKWNTLQACCDTLDRSPHSKYNGVGFVLNIFQGLVFIDLDHHLTDGKLDNVAYVVTELFPDTYTEVSQSGEGLHLFVHGSIPHAVKNADKGVEMYNTGRYCACTFNSYNGSKQITGEPQGLKFLYDKFKTKKDEPKRALHSPPPVSSQDNETIIKRACKSDRVFDDLYHGKWQEHYPSQSEADYSLMCKLSFWCDRDPVQMERIFNSSGLATRAKWEREDYRQRTIEGACNDVAISFHEWKWQKAMDKLADE